MDGAQVVMAVNIWVAAMFAFGYAVIALTNSGQRAALWFSASYVVGMLCPAADFLSTIIHAPVFFEWMSFSCFLVATLSISATLAFFHRISAPWLAMAAIFCGGIISRIAIWDVPRDSLVYGLGYQWPFVLASLLAMWSVWRVADRSRPLHFLLAALYAVTALHFLGKPFLAKALGPGDRLEDYVTTTYALLSQASTGVLLLASGMVLLLIIAQKAIADSLLASVTDQLTGLANRRGFEERAVETIKLAARQDAPVSLAIFDLDHFKSVNDMFGHEVGDRVIVDFAELLREVSPEDALVARQGGEEFVMLLEGATERTIALHAERIRVGAATAQRPGRPSPTVSVGCAERKKGETLAGLMRRADAALYRAKHDGRDRVCVAEISELHPNLTSMLRLVGQRR